MSKTISPVNGHQEATAAVRRAGSLAARVNELHEASVRRAGGPAMHELRKEMASRDNKNKDMLGHVIKENVRIAAVVDELSASVVGVLSRLDEMAVQMAHLDALVKSVKKGK